MAAEPLTVDAELFEIREVRPADYAALGALTIAAYETLFAGDVNPGYAAELVDVARRAAESTVLVAVAGGEIVGGLNYTSGPGTYWSDTGGDEEAGIRMLAVAPGAQGRGFGTALVDACVRRAEAENRSRLSLHTMEPMATAHRIYQRAGFKRAPGRDFEGETYRLIAYVREL
ncbi:MAG: GNAT family N-acetyltransferase [Actinomycetota bacterium]|nr:GNAT family N-acetyltransferase [Actinomycetota bacterium]